MTVRTIAIKKGLDLPIQGAPRQAIETGAQARSAALLGDDYVGMKPTLFVQVGDRVKKGQKLFEDKKNPGVLFTSPVSGVVRAIHRGDRRVFQSVVVDCEGDDQVQFSSYQAKPIDSYSVEEVQELLVESGWWTALRTRPFSKSPALNTRPVALFVTATETRPLGADPEVVLARHLEDFKAGLRVLAKLPTRGLHVVTRPNSVVRLDEMPSVQHTAFTGPHPAGNVGTHLHFLNPVSPKVVAWHVNYQDVIAMGRLFSNGEYFNQRVVAIAGPAVREPRLVQTFIGADLEHLTSNESSLAPGLYRTVSGSVFGGRTANPGPFGYLGRFHLGITLLREGGQREFLGWQSPGLEKYSVKNSFVSRLFSGKKFAFHTGMYGSKRAIVPIGSYEKVMPLDILITYLLRELMAGNTEQAAKLGALELDEEDLSLCTFVDPCKNEYGPALRSTLTTLEKEGGP